jgi:hypothetical protein
MGISMDSSAARREHDATKAYEASAGDPERGRVRAAGAKRTTS